MSSSQNRDITPSRITKNFDYQTGTNMSYLRQTTDRKPT